jgi:hypothetical protein
LAAVNVRTLEAAAVPLRDVAEKAAVTPLGRPAIDRAIAELKPFDGDVATVSFTLLPALTFSDAELGVSVNVGAGITTEMASFAVCPAPVAATVSAYVPGVAEELAVTVKTSEPEPGDAIVLEANTAVTPVGAPEVTNVTADFRLALAVEVMVV